MKKLLAVAATAALTSLAVVGPAHSTPQHSPQHTTQRTTQQKPAAATQAREVNGTFMIGDSTTYRIAPELQRLRPDWYLDFQRGRSIRTLASHIDRYLRHNPVPANFIMALGTNRCHHPDWSEARLRRAIAKLPARTNVFLVMVVRAGEFQADKDAVLQEYNSYSRNLAKTRPNTYIIDWRGTVLADPTLDPVTGLSSLLEDGTHETGGPYGDRRGPGVRTYIDLVLSKWRQVNRATT
ncbi:MAG TPA: hypothetical protein PLZ93_10755 [Nocardioides sp.]|uniref:hypothetical protein n=1 Tax=uncultured Nocardioides sp. TaxID=198441 RepID=UPI000EE90F3E|nr:hypothetical protein [uncultured Nocardioides sp.]HCB03320.1 hypothetical protein [Nocardioides sp.]HRD60755.1 hypothetical protein [Nocardioides sp.]HRI96086.1 hypothetical protein [Nocardioides sp.]HRK45418.1 hypothetical protein [Nocardioides sp.]